MISNPSQAEYLKRQFETKKAEVENLKKKQLLEKYLDGKEQKVLDPRLRLGQTEVYVEYDSNGRVKVPDKGTVSILGSVRTKYEEDIYINNHTSVWGSYFNR